MIADLRRLTGYGVRVSRFLPYESEQADGSTMRVDYTVDHVNRVIVMSQAAFEALKAQVLT